MKRFAVLVILILILGLTITAAGKKKKSGSKGEIGADWYTLTVEGAVRTSVTEAVKDGEPIWTATNTTTILPQESIDYIPVTPRKTVTTLRLPDGETKEAVLTRYQWIKPVISCRFAYTIGDGTRTLDGCRHIDLEGPVRKDHTWEFKALRLEPEPAVAAGLTFDHKARIGRYDLTLNIGSRTYTDCLTVTTTGRAATAASDTCADGSTATGVIETTATRWLCPGTGPVKEVRSVRLKTGERLCTEYHFEEILKSIEGR